VVPARRHRYDRNSYGNCGGGDREMVHSLTPEHLALGNGLVFDGLNQTRVIVSPARHIDPFRDRPHAQKVIRRRPQQLDAALSG
jgi:hypothetical protein